MTTCQHDPSRRRFLSAATIAAAGALLPGSVPSLFGGQTRRSERRLVDVHHHVMPPAFVKATEGRFVNAGVVTRWSLDRALAEMDEQGVRTAFSSITQPGIWFGNAEAARTLARSCNEYMARIAADHPGRFGFFAALPLPDAEGSLRELEYALDTLKADGIGLLTSYEDRWLGHASFTPVFEELNRRRAIVYVHPNAPDCCRGLMPEVTPNMIEYPHDTTRAITSLMFSGTLGKMPAIRFIFSHGGGTLPMLAGRIAQLATPQDLQRIPEGVEAQLRQLFYEVANAANRASFSALSAVAPTSQILFGTDYPFIPIAATADGLAKLMIAPGSLEAITYGNAAALLPRARQTSPRA